MQGFHRARWLKWSSFSLTVTVEIDFYTQFLQCSKCSSQWDNNSNAETYNTIHLANDMLSPLAKEAKVLLVFW